MNKELNKLLAFLTAAGCSLDHFPETDDFREMWTAGGESMDDTLVTLTRYTSGHGMPAFRLTFEVSERIEPTKLGLGSVYEYAAHEEEYVSWLTECGLVELIRKWMQ